MLKTKNFGRKSLNEIKEILLSMNLDFGMQIDERRIKRIVPAPAGAPETPSPSTPLIP